MLLPDFIVPYLSYSLPMILLILSDYLKRRLTIRGICEKYMVSPPLIYRFKKLFLLHKNSGSASCVTWRFPLFPSWTNY